ncbi:DNA alkylation repair protein [Nocardioides euryhalodurans]|uniref:DNA alkylation repair protein n=1 Tax=Nocardioides euryhalodurans TaxID=2518370 RepID=A0A4P7GIB1_9ACTN|nr:DNA alkylation repair protein [Nocardioides euryhalodurans]QBR91417.1 DNA alkylation repair protein [Nocardioides euryhalodurans]
MTGQVDHALVSAVREALADHADPERAVQQQRYMKSVLPFHGLSSATLRSVLRPLLAAHRIDDRAVWEGTAHELWDGATHREEWYAVLALLRHRYYRGWQQPDVLPLHLHLVRTGAWWDVVDEIAAHLVGGVLAGHRDAVTPTIRGWAVDDHLWVRRTAILSQLRHGGGTDVALLAEVLDHNLTDSRHGADFFIRKAVGWALRQHARTDPAWVTRYVAEREPRLSGLSRREALKHLSAEDT